MKRMRLYGAWWAVYDRLHQRMLADANAHNAADHKCSSACDPPTEADLLEFYESLDDRHRDMVMFIGVLHSTKFGVPFDTWHNNQPIELLPTAKGEH